MRKKVRLRPSKRNELSVLPYMVVVFLLLINFFLVSMVSEEKETKVTAPVIAKQGSSYPEAIQIINKGIKTSEQAEDMCLELETKNDKCLFYVAKEYKEPKICKSIESENFNDVCFMYFVANHDYEICENIQKSNIRASCSALKRLREVDEDFYA
ncbi:MAG: ExbD/TolR family protein [Nanoarchaeota archaeon]